MRTRIAFAGLVVWALIAVSGCASHKPACGTAAEGDKGFVTVFDGKSMDGWEIYNECGDANKTDDFHLENGVLACKAYGGFWFRYKEPLTDFVVRLEFKTAKDSNSGVCIHTTKEGAPPYTGFEVQIFDDHGQHPNRHSCGSIYDIVTPMYNASRPTGQWNEMEITCKGPHTIVILNGLKVIDTDFSKLTKPIGKFDFPYSNLPKTGYLALQDHSSPIWYRNIRLKKM